MVERNKFVQIHAWISVRRQAHDFPFVAVGHEAEILRELRVEKSKRIGPRNREHMIEASSVAVPDGARFPGATSVHHDDAHDRVLNTNTR